MESNKGVEGEEAKAEQEAPEEEDPVKKELETKNREIIDLKVNQIPQAAILSLIKTHSLGQIPPLRRRLPQPPRAHKTRHPVCQRLCHPTLRQRPH